MARIRTIKPEFWTSEQVMECSTTSRLLFIGMWNFCDDAGNHPAAYRTLKAEVFPADDFTALQVEALVSELIASGLVAEYEADGKRYWHVTGWHHQRIEKPNFKHPTHENRLLVEERSPTSRRPVEERTTTILQPVEERSTPEGKWNGIGEGRDVDPSGAPGESADKRPQISGPAAPMPAEVDSPAIDGELLPDPKPKPPAKQQQAESTSAEQEACRATWAAYADAYEQRYGVAPIRNAKVNAAIKGFTRRVGSDESPGVARYYLQHQDAFYARKCHDAGLMQQDAEKLRTEWATQRQVTGVAARQQERAGTMLSAVDRILAKREAAA